METENNQNDSSRPEATIFRVLIALIFSCFVVVMLFIFGICYLGYLFFSDLSLWRTEKNISSTFFEYTESISEVSNLELAVRNTVETVTRSEEKIYRLPMNSAIKGAASVTIRCPVTYTYYVNMRGRWKFRTENKTLYVTAPPLECALPAIDTSGIERKTDAGWLIFGETAMMRDLERDLSRELQRKALDPGHIELVREKCRESLSEFLENWTAHRDWDFEKIIIKFANEPGKVLFAGKDKEFKDVERDR